MKEFKVMIIWILICLATVFIFQLGITYDRWDIRRTIKQQEETRATRTIRIPQLRMNLVPFERGFIDWIERENHGD
jgi:hypothetical protein